MKLINNYSDFNLVYEFKQSPTMVMEPQKSVRMLRSTSKSLALADELNTISKSLESTLR